MKKQIVALLAGAMLMMATSAMAVPIDGSISFSGALDLVGGSTLPEATGIHFVNPALVAGDVTGVYAGIPTFPTTGLTLVTFQDFTYSPSLSPSPVTPLWTLTYGVNVYDFDLSTISSVTATSLSGTGVLGATGYEDTLGNWQLTTQSGEGVLSFSATSTVPEPGTMMLLGLGMFGLAIYGKRRMNKEA